MRSEAAFYIAEELCKKCGDWVPWISVALSSRASAGGDARHARFQVEIESAPTREATQAQSQTGNFQDWLLTQYEVSPARNNRWLSWAIPWWISCCQSLSKAFHNGPLFTNLEPFNHRLGQYVFLMVFFDWINGFILAWNSQAAPRFGNRSTATGWSSDRVHNIRNATVVSSTKFYFASSTTILFWNNPSCWNTADTCRFNTRTVWPIGKHAHWVDWQWWMMIGERYP